MSHIYFLDCIRAEAAQAQHHARQVITDDDLHASLPTVSSASPPMADDTGGVTPIPASPIGRDAATVPLCAELHLWFPPSANKIWRRSGNVIHRSEAYMKWRSDMGTYVKSQKPVGIVGPYKMIVTAARPDKKRRDLDNLLKPIGDLLVDCGVVDDDSQCEMIVARWVTQGDGIAVRIEPAGRE